MQSEQPFWGYRRENGRVGVRNHVIILPVDDLSNAACEAVANNIKGTLAIPHPYGRLQFGADLDLHFRTLIGTGSNPNVAAVVVIGIEEQWTKKVVDGIAATGKPVVGLRHRVARRPRHDHARVEGGDANSCSGRARSSASSATLKELWVSTKCGESDTTSGCGSNPTVGDAFDKLYAAGCTLVFGETTELTGGEQIVAARCRDDKVRAEFMRVFDRYQEVINRHKTSDLSDSQPTKGNIAGGLTTIEEKALGNIQKIGKKCVVDGVLDKAEVPTRPGPVVHGLVVGGGGNGHAVRGVRLRRAFLSDRAGQRHRQSDPAGDQDLRESAHGAHDERAHRRRHIGPASARDHDERSGRQAARDDVPHRQRPADCRRGAGPSGVRADPPLRERVSPAVEEGEAAADLG